MTYEGKAFDKTGAKSLVAALLPGATLFAALAFPQLLSVICAFMMYIAYSVLVEAALGRGREIEDVLSCFCGWVAGSGQKRHAAQERSSASAWLSGGAV
jgi:hypothetical protein